MPFCLGLSKMTNSFNSAGAPAGFVVSNGEGAPKYASRRRPALLGSSALIGIALTASPAMGQSFTAGGGTIVVDGGSATNVTVVQGGFEATDSIPSQ